MSAGVRLETHDGFGVVTLDTPDSKVNILSAAAIAEIDAILRQVQNSPLKALFFRSAKPRIFIAGADIREIESISSAQEGEAKSRAGHEVLNRLEDLPFPSVALINGVALGGGLEFALACSYRFAAFGDDVKIGLPEVKLGIIPGFGGTWRLPARTGLRKGLELIAEGKTLDAERAYSAGLVDGLTAEPLLFDTAKEYLEKIGYKKGVHRPRRQQPIDKFLEGPGRSIVRNAASKAVREATKGHYPAPLAAVDVVVASYGASRKDAIDREAREFGRLIEKGQYKKLISVFYLTERYKKEQWSSEKPSPVRKCGVVGAGVMGGGIAQLVSSLGTPVRMKDVNAQALLLGLSSAKRLFDEAVKKRRLPRAVADTSMGLISPTLDYSGFRHCDVMIEAVVENMDVKKKVFADMERAAGPEAVLATNTSSLSVAEMASAVSDPGRVVGMHFFNPVHKMPLVEVVRAAKTSEKAVATIVQFSRDLRKTPIVVKDAPGFLVNRLLLPYLNEAGYLLEEGSSIETIDRALFAFGMPMAAFRLMDEIGLDVGYKVAQVLEKAFGERMRPPALLGTVYEKKWFGKKTGKGFYLYESSRKKGPPNGAISPASGGAARAHCDEEITGRCIGVMVNEAARCLEEGIVREPADVDIGMIMGTGFPPFRGGLLRHADDTGVDKIVADLEKAAAKSRSPRHAPSPALKSRKKFYAS